VLRLLRVWTALYYNRLASSRVAYNSWENSVSMRDFKIRRMFRTLVPKVLRKKTKK